MPGVAFNDLVTSSVQTAPSPATSGTSLVLQAGTGAAYWPDPATAGQYDILMWPDGTLPTRANAEIATVTARSSDTLTIVRAQGTPATTAQSVSTSFRVALIESRAAHGFPLLDNPASNGQPAAPNAGAVLFARSIGGPTAGKYYPAYIGPSGLDTALQPLIGRNRTMLIQPNGSTAVTANGVAVSTTGTGTAPSFATTNLHQSMNRIDYLVTTAATTAVAGWRASVNTLWRGNAAGLGGFLFICRFGPATGVATTTSRLFCGLGSSTAAPTDVEPSSLANVLGVGYDAADTNLNFMTKTGSGTVAKTDLGASFAVPTTDRTKVYELAMFAKPNDTQVSYEVTDLVSGAVANGVVSASLPANTTFLSPRGWASVGGTSSVIGFALMGCYIECDL